MIVERFEGLPDEVTVAASALKAGMPFKLPGCDRDDLYVTVEGENPHRSQIVALAFGTEFSQPGHGSRTVLPSSARVVPVNILRIVWEYEQVTT